MEVGAGPSFGFGGEDLVGWAWLEKLRLTLPMQANNVSFFFGKSLQIWFLFLKSNK